MNKAVVQIVGPTLVISRSRAQNNIGQMAAKAEKSGVIFRPHFKTHQSSEIGNWFRKYGVRHITVSSAQMAEYFAQHGWTDITIAFPVNILEIEKLRKRFAPKLARLTEKIEKAEGRVQREQSQYDHQKLQTAISFGSTLLGALFGRKLASSRNVGRATTAARSAGRAAREREDIARANEEVVRLKEQFAQLEQELEDKAENLRALPSPAELHLEEVSIRPRKSDISVTEMALVWSPM